MSSRGNVSGGSIEVINTMSAMNKREPRLLFEQNRRHFYKWATLVVLGSGSYLFASRLSAVIHVPAWDIEIAGILIAVLAMYAMSRSFRCPDCHANLLFHAQFREPIGNFIERALTYSSCPKCGYRMPDGQA